MYIFHRPVPRHFYLLDIFESVILYDHIT